LNRIFRTKAIQNFCSIFDPAVSGGRIDGSCRHRRARRNKAPGGCARPEVSGRSTQAAPMLSLILAAVFWVALHLGAAGPLRPALVARLGEGGYRGLFSGLSAVGLVWLVLAYRGAPYVALWPPAPFAMAAVLVFLGFLLLAYSLGPTNPTQVASERLGEGGLQVAGITRVTRHPMLWAFTLWALAHLLVNGHLAGLLLFGAILVTALNGMVSIDRKRAASLGAAWGDFARRTSRLPFAAILAGRSELNLGELASWRLGLGVALFIAALWLHGFL
jgi:uncharacterized membrane protein